MQSLGFLAVRIFDFYSIRLRNPGPGITLTLKDRVRGYDVKADV